MVFLCLVLFMVFLLVFCLYTTVCNPFYLLFVGVCFYGVKLPCFLPCFALFGVCLDNLLDLFCLPC